MEFKYLIIDKIKPVIFAHGIEHIDEANGRNVTSAGFVRILPGGDVECFGRSTSLNIDSQPVRDQRIIIAIGKSMAR